MAPRTPLVRPGRYVEEHGVRPRRGVLAAVVFVALVVGAVFGIGRVLTANVDGAVDEGPGGSVHDVDESIREAVADQAVAWLVGALAVLVLVVVLLHVGSGILDGDGRVRESFAVAAWGLVPGGVAMVGGVAVLAATFGPVTVDPTTNAAAVENHLVSTLAPMGLYWTVVGFATAVWSAVVWRVGVEACHDLTGRRSTHLSIVVAVVVLLLLP